MFALAVDTVGAIWAICPFFVLSLATVSTNCRATAPCFKMAVSLTMKTPHRVWNVGLDFNLKITDPDLLWRSRSVEGKYMSAACLLQLVSHEENLFDIANTLFT